MIALVIMIAVGIVLIIAALSVRANARFRHEDRLPMQWSLSGRVNWTAPRVLALSFTPALAVCALTFFVVLVAYGKSRPGHEGEVLPVLLLFGGILIAAHSFHLWLIGRTVRRNGG